MSAAMSILSILAINPNWSIGSDLSLGELGVYLQKHVGTLAENERNARHRLRDELYRDGGCHHMRNLIDEVFADHRIRELRKRWVRYTRFNNALKRIVNELATVYAEPATRTLPNEADAERYRQLLKAVAFDEQMLQMSRLLNLHRAMLVALRIRNTATVGDDGNFEREPVLDLVTPADARVILHPFFT